MNPGQDDVKITLNLDRSDETEKIACQANGGYEYITKEIS